MELSEANSPKKILLEMLLCTKYGWTQHPCYKNNENCTICLENMMGKYILELACEHKYDYDCILMTLADYDWLKCPLCELSYTVQR